MSKKYIQNYALRIKKEKEGKVKGRKYVPAQKYLKKGSTIDSSFKIKLIVEGLLENKCVECGLLPEWNEKTLVLHLDHINGDRKDNRLENLRLLCPNCHSQTPTYARQKFKKTKNIVKENLQNNNVVEVSPTPYRYLEWPTKEELADLLLNVGNFSEIGRRYGVSDNAVRKWAKKYKLL